MKRLATALVCTAVAGSACSEPSDEAKNSTRSLSAFTIPVYVREPAFAEVVVPRAGWLPSKEDGNLLPVRTISQSVTADCRKLLQLSTRALPRGNDQAKVRRPRRAALVRTGHRDDLVRADGRSNQVQISYKVFRTDGIVFGGGATGPGGYAVVQFAGRTGRFAQVEVQLVVQGGADGFGCTDPASKRASLESRDVLEKIATSVRLRVP